MMETHTANWYYVYYKIEDNGKSKAVHYPSTILGFLQDGKEVNVKVQCAIEPVPWSNWRKN